MSTLARYEPNQALTPAQRALGRVADGWKHDARGAKFIEAFTSWLKHLTNPNTRRSYSYAVLEFFDYYEAKRGYVPTPDRVTRDDAVEFAEWLKHRTLGLDEHRLKKDPTRRMDARIYEFVLRHPMTHFGAIRRELLLVPEFTTFAQGQRMLEIEVGDVSALDKLLGCMVEQKRLTRIPSIEEIRLGKVGTLGMDDVSQASLAERVDPEIFAYSVHPHTQATGPARSSTVVLRLTALSSFWRHMQATGDNLGSKPLLEHDIWKTTAYRQARVQSAAQKKISRARKTPDIALFERMLQTTYDPPDYIHNIRDRAVLLFLFYEGVRAEELGRLRRSDVLLQETPPLVVVTGKGDKTRMFPLEEPAHRAIVDLWTKIDELALKASRGSPTEARMERLQEAGAPLFPTLAEWGCNAYSATAAEDHGMRPSAINMMLRRRAVAAGVDLRDVEMAKVHPHGIRHLFALHAVDLGTPLPVVQARLGHENLATTSTYVEARDPRSLTLGPPVAPGAPAPRPPMVGAVPTYLAPEPKPEAPAPPVRRPKVIETVGVPVEEPAAAPPSRREAPPAAKRESAERFLERVYKEHWGEAGDRSKLHVRKEALEGSDVERTEDMLTQAYVGKQSGLVWWDGWGGHFRYAMPVIAPMQVCDVGDPSCDPSLLRDLEKTWVRWVNDQELVRKVDKAGRPVLDDKGEPVLVRLARGPTAATALLKWFMVAMEVTEQVDLELDRRGGVWVPFDAPLDVTGPSHKGTRFRAQATNRVVEWFDVFGWRYEESIADPASAKKEARVSRPLDTRPFLPSYYRAADPVAELPLSERSELFDWLSVLVGKAPVDKTRRFGKFSRADLGAVIDQLCAYDAARDALGEAKQAEKKREVPPGAVQEAKEALAAQRETVNMWMTALLGKPFDIAEKVEKRVEETKIATFRAKRKEKPEASEQEIAAEATTEGEQDDKRRVQRREFYMKMMGDLFGPDAAKDDILRLMASCKASQPLSSDEYKDFFRVDTKAGTIVHTAEFQKEFAKHMGTHSECVARRLARDLWELRRESARRRVFDPSHREELIARIGAMQAYKLPCSVMQERELRERLRAAGVKVDDGGELRRTWAKAIEHQALSRAMAEESRLAKAVAAGEGEETELQRRAAIASEFETATKPSFEEMEGMRVFGGRREPNPASPPVGSLMPGPVTCIYWLKLR